VLGLVFPGVVELTAVGVGADGEGLALAVLVVDVETALGFAAGGLVPVVVEPVLDVAMLAVPVAIVIGLPTVGEAALSATGVLWHPATAASAQMPQETASRLRSRPEIRGIMPISLPALPH
jgi:hypothetical protein